MENKRLEVEDVDTEANIIIIKSDNNKRKRMLRLSPNLNWHIEKYKLKHNPKKIFFPGSGGEGYYSARNIQLFFQKALFEAGINKHATLLMCAWSTQYDLLRLLAPISLWYFHVNQQISLLFHLCPSTSITMRV